MAAVRLRLEHPALPGETFDHIARGQRVLARFDRGEATTARERDFNNPRFARKLICIFG